MRMFGYARISAKDQNEIRQLIALRGAGVEDGLIYVDKRSGKDFDRVQYKKMIERLHPGDVLVVKSIDRLGRNYDEIIYQWRMLTKEMGVDIVILDMPLLDTREKDVELISTFISDIVLQILSYVAQAERESIHQRQREGIDAALQQGVRFGRPKLSSPPEFPRLLDGWKKEGRSMSACAKMMGVSCHT